MLTSDLTLWFLCNSATCCCSLSLKSPKGTGQLQFQLQLLSEVLGKQVRSEWKKTLPFDMLIFWDFELKIWAKRKRPCALQVFLTHTKTKCLLTRE